MLTCMDMSLCDVSCNTPQVTCIFSYIHKSLHSTETLWVYMCIMAKYRKNRWKWDQIFHGISEKSLHKYFIPCHRKYTGPHNQCDALAGKVWWHSNDYITRAFLNSYWLLFYGINMCEWFAYVWFPKLDKNCIWSRYFLGIPQHVVIPKHELIFFYLTCAAL